jgi:hypothetical protein
MIFALTGEKGNTSGRAHSYGIFFLILVLHLR